MDPEAMSPILKLIEYFLKKCQDSNWERWLFGSYESGYYIISHIGNKQRS